MRLTDEKVVEVLTYWFDKSITEYEKQSAISFFIVCYNDLFILNPDIVFAPIKVQIAGVYFLMGIREMNLTLINSQNQFADAFVDALEDVNILEWALDVIKYNRT